MTLKEKAWELFDKCIIYHKNDIYNVVHKDITKEYALIVVDEIIEYHNSLFDQGFKDVHIAISSPIKTYNDILNPLLKYYQEVKQEIEKL